MSTLKKAKALYRGVTLVTSSANAKIGDVAATYAPIRQTCDRSCVLHPETGGACYAYQGHVGFTVRRLEKHAQALSDIELAIQEAALIRAAVTDGKHRGKPLRLHVSGDARTVESARELGAACTDWTEQGGGRPWTYTHAWAAVARAVWGPDVSVLASVDRLSDVVEARAQGYAPAITVDTHASAKAFTLGGVRYIPCPEQTRGVRCVDCRLCWDDDRLVRTGSGIAFAIHGSRAKAGSKLVTLRRKDQTQ